MSVVEQRLDAMRAVLAGATAERRHESLAPRFTPWVAASPDAYLRKPGSRCPPVDGPSKDPGPARHTKWRRSAGMSQLDKATVRTLASVLGSLITGLAPTSQTAPSIRTRPVTTSKSKGHSPISRPTSGTRTLEHESPIARVDSGREPMHLSSVSIWTIFRLLRC